MILVDTSVWVEALGPRPGAMTHKLGELIGAGHRVCITGIVLQEVLQGSRTPREFERIESYLTTLPFLEPLSQVDSYIEAARMYAKCRQAGVTPRSAIDCLIAQIAIEHDAVLLHRDNDYTRIAGVVRQLRLA